MKTIVIDHSNVGSVTHTFAIYSKKLDRVIANITQFGLTRDEAEQRIRKYNLPLPDFDDVYELREPVEGGRDA